MNKTKKILVISMASLLLFSGVLVAEADECPCISLPQEPVTMIVQDGTISYFDTYLSGVPDGYRVKNDQYLGWCAQRSITIPRGVPHEVILNCSYDPNMPDSFQDDDWDKVNWIVNNKLGGKVDIQDAIWHLIDDKPYADITSIAQTLVNNAVDGYCPELGDILVILADGGDAIQRTIFELPLYEGLTPGYWKNHLEDWVNYAPEGIVGDVFDLPTELASLNDKTLLDALEFKGKNTIIGAARILLRQAVAAVLNTAHPDVSYPISETQVITAVNNALASLDRDTILDLKDMLDEYNNYKTG